MTYKPNKIAITIKGTQKYRSYGIIISQLMIIIITTIHVHSR